MNSGGGHGPKLFRPYALTGGRTVAAVDMALETLVSTTAAGRRALASVPGEQRTILRLCREAISVVEVAARLCVPLGVARVLVADLVVADLVELHGSAVPDPGATDYRVLLEKVLHGIDEL
jgi:hypothetical protein